MTRKTKNSLERTLVQQLGYTPADLNARIHDVLAQYGLTSSQVPQSELVAVLIDALTVNHTEVFRHAPHFTTLESKLQEMKRKRIPLDSKARLLLAISNR